MYSLKCLSILTVTKIGDCDLWRRARLQIKKNVECTTNDVPSGNLAGSQKFSTLALTALNPFTGGKRTIGIFCFVLLALRNFLEYPSSCCYSNSPQFSFHCSLRVWLILCVRPFSDTHNACSLLLFVRCDTSKVAPFCLEAYFEAACWRSIPCRCRAIAWRWVNSSLEARSLFHACLVQFVRASSWCLFIWCFLSLLKRLFSFWLFVANCTKRSQWTRRTWTRKIKKMRRRLVLDDLRLYVSRVMLPVSLSRIYSQSWGSSVDALNTTYPPPLPDHRVLLTVVFVPLAHFGFNINWSHHDDLLLHLRG